jgi:hypothetical protein
MTDIIPKRHLLYLVVYEVGGDAASTRDADHLSSRLLRLDKIVDPGRCTTAQQRKDRGPSTIYYHEPRASFMLLILLLLTDDCF